MRSDADDETETLETLFEDQLDSPLPSERDETSLPAEDNGADSYQDSEAPPSGTESASSADTVIKETVTDSGTDDQSPAGESATTSASEAESESDTTDDDFDTADFM